MRDSGTTWKHFLFSKIALVFSRFRVADGFSIFVIRHLGETQAFRKVRELFAMRQVTLLSNCTENCGPNSQNVRFSLSKKFKGSCTFPVTVHYRFLVLFLFCRSFLRTRRTAEEKFTTSTCVASCSILTMVRKTTI